MQGFIRRLTRAPDTCTTPVPLFAIFEGWQKASIIQIDLGASAVLEPVLKPGVLMHVSILRLSDFQSGSSRSSLYKQSAHIELLQHGLKARECCSLGGTALQRPQAQRF